MSTMNELVRHPRRMEEDQESSQETGQHSALSAPFRHWAELTGVHAVPNLFAAKYNFWRVFWLFLALGGTGICIWQIYEIQQKYISYPTKTSIERMYLRSMDFPAVTFCNLCPLSWSRVKVTSPDIAQLFSENENVQAPEIGKKRNSSSYKNWQNVETNGNRTDTKQRSNFAYLYNSHNSSEKEEMGFQIQDMLLDCQFNGRHCGTKDFQMFTNTNHGNCFMFNSDFDETGRYKRQKKPGVSNGLSVSLYIDQAQYMPGVIDTAGIKLVIHHQKTMPFPDEEGLELSPGLHTSLPFQTKVFQSLTPQWGRCINVTSKEKNISLNAYTYNVPSVQYSQEACVRSCIQRRYMEECGCFHPMMASPQAETFADIDSSKKVPCQEYGRHEDCVAAVEVEYELNGLNCTSKGKCEFVPCTQYEYPITPTFALWPSDKFQNEYENDIQQSSRRVDEMLSTFNSTDARIEWAKKNYLKFTVYQRNFELDYYQTDKSYELWPDVFSDLGGQLGLWLGFSMITCFEFIELFLDVFWALMKFMCCKKKKEVQNEPGAAVIASGLQKSPFSSFPGVDIYM